MTRRVLGLGCLAGVLLAGSGAALERTPVSEPGPDGSDWLTAESLTITYYNACTGWSWAWSPWETGERVGVVFEVPIGDAVLETTTHLVRSAEGTGWGFTGVIEVYASDENDCPTGLPLAQTYWAPRPWATLHTIFWGGVAVPQRFVVAVTFQAPTGFLDPVKLLSDHPAAGPTGPAACGLCYPTTRAAHSFRYGMVASPLCPGETFADPLCDAELGWTAFLSGVTAVESSSWTGIKGLYRYFYRTNRTPRLNVCPAPALRPMGKAVHSTSTSADPSAGRSFPPIPACVK